MVLNLATTLKPETVGNSGVVSVPLVIIREASRKMSSDETQSSASIFEPNSHSSLIPCDPRHAGLLGCQSKYRERRGMNHHLLQAPLYVLDLTNHRRAHKNQQGSTNKLPTSKRHIWIVGVPVEALKESTFPKCFSGWICGHDLLRTQFNNLLEANHDQLRILLRLGKKCGAEPFLEIVINASSFAVDIECARIDVNG
jgi:hypothetical protein